MTTAMEKPTVTELTKDDFLSVWDEFSSAVAEWEASKSDTLLVFWKGRTVKVVSEAVEKAFEPVAHILNTQVIDENGESQQVPVAPDAWPLVLAMDDFYFAFVAWADSIRNDPRETDPHGSKEMWHAFHAVKGAGAAPTAMRVESVQQLTAQKVSPTTIAKIYGWYDEAGDPDLGKVADELEHPGTHTKDWVNPIVSKRINDLTRRWRNRCAGFTNRSVPRTDKAPDQPVKNSPVAPEPIETLLRLPGMTIEQVAKMKKMTVEEVRKIAVKTRIAIDDNIADMIRQEAAGGIPALQEALDRQRSIDVADLYTYDNLDTLEERIWAMSDDKISTGLIASALKPFFPALDFMTVERIQRERFGGDGKPNLPKRRKQSKASRAKKQSAIDNATGDSEAPVQS